MEPAPAVNVLHCAQCGGELHPDEGQIFLTCPYCSSTIYVDKSQVVFHWSLAPTMDESQARAALARWMSGSQTVKDLDKKASLVSSSFEYFPLWLFKYKQGADQEALALEPAAATSVSEILRIVLPAGDLQKYDPALDSTAQAPTVPLQAALGWLKEHRQVDEVDILERSLVHIPLYTFKYSFQGKSYTAQVDAAAGNVFANLYPAKAEVPFNLIGGLAALTFLCLATFPVAGALVARTQGFGIGLAACSILGLIAAPVLFALAAWIAAKV